MHTPKHRNKYLAALLNLFICGLGYVYVGRIKYAVALLFTLYLSLIIAGRAGFLIQPLFFFFFAIVIICIWIFSVISAAWIAAKRNQEEPRIYQRWYYCLGYAFLVLIIGNVYITHRASITRYESFRVPSGSMQDAILVGDFIIVDARPKTITSVGRGDIIVFTKPGEELKYLKRIIGINYDHIQLSNNKLLVNGEEYPEPYINPEYSTRIPEKGFEFIVPENAFFVMGDNRDNSSDSRFWGAVPKESVHGKAIFIWWSFDPINFTARFDRAGKYIE